uniref:Putative secreted protein n=1 Tax=Ixodes ricinus TaxID=34613 RepID=A0A6B0UCB2_IXORI
MSNSMIFCLSRTVLSCLLSFCTNAMVSTSSRRPLRSVSAFSNISCSHFSLILCRSSMLSGDRFAAMSMLSPVTQKLASSGVDATRSSDSKFSP